MVSLKLLWVASMVTTPAPELTEVAAVATVDTWSLVLTTAAEAVVPRASTRKNVELPEADLMVSLFAAVVPKSATSPAAESVVSPAMAWFTAWAMLAPERETPFTGSAAAKPSTVLAVPFSTWMVPPAPLVFEVRTMALPTTLAVP